MNQNKVILSEEDIKPGEASLRKFISEQLETPTIDPAVLQALRLKDAHEKIQKTLRLARWGIVISGILACVAMFQGSWLLSIEKEVFREPRLEVRIEQGQRVKTHTYRYQLSLANAGTRYANGAEIVFRIPREMMMALNGKIPPPIEEKAADTMLNHSFTGKIDAGGHISLGPVIFKFLRPEPFNEIAYEIRSPEMNPIRGTLVVTDQDYWDDDGPVPDVIIFDRTESGGITEQQKAVFFQPRRWLSLLGIRS